MDYIDNDLFAEKSVYNYDIGESVKKIVIKERIKNSWGNYDTKDIPIGEIIKTHFNQRINEELKKKVEEIIATSDYQQKVEEIANELIDYSINGYKEDMKNRIRERLVGNMMDTAPTYDGVNLIHLIESVVDSKIHY